MSNETEARGAVVGSLFVAVMLTLIAVGAVKSHAARAVPEAAIAVAADVPSDVAPAYEGSQQP